jgi:hypothetical protein
MCVVESFVFFKRLFVFNVQLARVVFWTVPAFAVIERKGVLSLAIPIVAKVGWFFIRVAFVHPFFGEFWRSLVDV